MLTKEEEMIRNLEDNQHIETIRKSDIKLGVFFFLIILSLWLILSMTVYFIQPDLISRAQFGDMFGSVNSLFSGLAFGGLIYTIYLQRKELTLQRKELVLTRNELMRSAKAQEESEKAMTAQLKSMTTATNINGLTAIINYYNNIAESTVDNVTKKKAEEKMGLAINEIAEYMDKLNDELNQYKS